MSLVENFVSKIDSIQLNMGIKRRFYCLLNEFDSRFVSPFFESILVYISRRIIAYYRADYGSRTHEKSQNLSWERGSLGYGLIHYSLVRNLGPKRILCIGSTYGFIPFILALACRHNGFGQVDFVDAGYDIQNPKDAHRHHFGQGFWKKINPQKHFSYLRVSRRISTYVMTSERFSKKHPERHYKYIYIDGDHSYQGVKKDFELFWPKLTKNGLMAFHDISRRDYCRGVEFGCWRFWKELKKQKGSCLEFPNPAAGLGILQK